MLKHICLEWQQLPDVVNKTKNCTVMTAGEQQSSRSQDLKVRPQGIDYCLGFVMDVGTMHSRTENKTKTKAFDFRNYDSTALENAHKGCVFLLHAQLTAFPAKKKLQCAPSSPWRRHRLPQHKTVDEQTSNRCQTWWSHHHLFNYFSVVVANIEWDRQWVSCTHTL